MKRNIMRSLSAILAVLLAMTLSFAVLANDSSDVVDESVEESVDASAAESVDASSEESADASSEVSADASEEGSKEESKAESKEESAETSKESSANVGNNANGTTAPVVENDFPWARVITLIVIVVLIVAAIILSKTNTAFGQKINKFFKEYWSEIKKVSWYSPKDTMKATGIVLVFIVGAAIAIGLLDFGFTKLIQLLANIF